MITVVAVVLLVALAVILGDRACARLAERAVSSYLAGPFGEPPTVRVHGAVFLTQAVRGRYPRVELSGSNVWFGELVATGLTARVHNASLPARELLGRRVSSLCCECLVGQLLMPYGELARVTRIPGLALDYANGRLVATASLPVPGVSQLARVSGAARLSIVGDGIVWLRVRGLSVAGISLPGAVLRQLVPSLNMPIPLPRLPYGLRLDELTPLPAGLLVSGSADNVTFAPRPGPTN